MSNMVYKIPMESMFTAIYFGSSYNRHDLYEYEDGVITLTGLKVTPEQAEHIIVAQFNLETGIFTAFVWDDVVRSLKQTVSIFMMNVLGTFDVEGIVGPAGFVDKWEPRLDMRKKMQNFQTWVRNGESNVTEVSNSDNII